MSLRPLPTLLSVLLLAGCSTPTTPVADPAPTTPTARSTPSVAQIQPATPPPAAAEMHPATIKGSQESSTLLDNFTAFITAIDGQPVAAGRKGWDQALALTPGPHRLAVEFNRGSFVGRTELAIEAKPGATYELQQANDAQVYGAQSFCEFWIVDLATGEKVVDPKRTGLEKLKP